MGLDVTTSDACACECVHTRGRDRASCIYLSTVLHECVCGNVNGVSVEMGVVEKLQGVH